MCANHGTAFALVRICELRSLLNVQIHLYYFLKSDNEILFQLLKKCQLKEKDTVDIKHKVWGLVSNNCATNFSYDWNFIYDHPFCHVDTKL